MWYRTRGENGGIEGDAYTSGGIEGDEGCVVDGGGDGERKGDIVGKDSKTLIVCITTYNWELYIQRGRSNGNAYDGGWAGRLAKPRSSCQVKHQRVEPFI